MHEGGFTVVGDGAGARFFDLAGIELHAASTPGRVGAHVYAMGTPAPGWDGQRVDYDAAVESLI